jgi:predicted kinase
VAHQYQEELPDRPCDRPALPQARILIYMISPFLILVDGPMGSGKTTTTKLLNQKLPNAARVARADIKRLIPNYKENEEALSVTRDVMHVMIDKYLERGVSVIVELITKTDGAEAVLGIAHKYGATFNAFRLTAPADLRLARVHERTREMMAINELPQSKIDELAGYFESDEKFFIDNPLDVAETIDTQSMTAEQVANAIIERLS